jgi:GTPase SAR1 family protein
MGKTLSKIFGKKEIRILMLGLDASGKTSELIEGLFDIIPLAFRYSVQAKTRAIDQINSDCWSKYF